MPNKKQMTWDDFVRSIGGRVNEEIPGNAVGDPILGIERYDYSPVARKFSAAYDAVQARQDLVNKRDALVQERQRINLLKHRDRLLRERRMIEQQDMQVDEDLIQFDHLLTNKR